MQNRFKPTTPEGAPPVYTDERAAWIGTFENNSEPVRIEAGAFRGRAVYFALIGTWKEEQLSEERAQVLTLGQANLFVQTLVTLILLVAGTVLAWRHYRSGRGDRQGASRMALAFFLLGVIVWLFRAHHVSDPVFEFVLFQRGMGPVLWLVSLMWVFYMALEPYVRRVWPETVISWTRLLAGKWFDPMVGRDILAGAAVGIITTLLALVEYQVPRWLNNAGTEIPVPLPSVTSVTLMLNSTLNFGSVFNKGDRAALSRLDPAVVPGTGAHGHQPPLDGGGIIRPAVRGGHHPLSRGRIVVETGTGEFSLPWNPVGVGTGAVGTVYAMGWWQ